MGCAVPLRLSPSCSRVLGLRLGHCFRPSAGPGKGHPRPPRGGRFAREVASWPPNDLDAAGIAAGFALHAFRRAIAGPGMGADPACRDAAPGPCAPIQKEHGAGTDGPPLRERSVGCPSRGKTGLRFAFPSASGSRFAWLYGRSLPARMSAFALLREWGNRLFEFGYDQRNRLGISVACAARFRRFCAVD